MRDCVNKLHMKELLKRSVFLLYLYIIGNEVRSLELGFGLASYIDLDKMWIGCSAD